MKEVHFNLNWIEKAVRDCLRTSISIGGDSDTLCAISCAIAEAYYGIPEDIKFRALQYLDKKILADYKEFEKFTKEKLGMWLRYNNILTCI